MDSEICTVGDLIGYLESNFKMSDRLCFFDEGGAWSELVHVPRSFIGDRRWMFNRVKDKMNEELDNPCCRKEDEEKMRNIIVNNYRNVNEEDVVIF